MDSAAQDKRGDKSEQASSIAVTKRMCAAGRKMSKRGFTVSPSEELTHEVTSYRNQDYGKLKKELLYKGMLFEDPYFDAIPKSLGYNVLGPRKTVGLRWLRPKDICTTSRPEFKFESLNRTDICQGNLGNCWFLAAAASLTLYPKLLARVVPGQQSFYTEYAGIFHFQFWQYGEWVDVVVDDRLPVEGNKLVFVKSDTQQEFWASLLEKAYAKLNGSYEALAGGWMGEAFVDFTGGINEHIDLRNAPYNIFEILKKAGRQRSLMGTSSTSKNASDFESVSSDGLVTGHAYSITGVWQVMRYRRMVKLVRLRNPWGRKEWQGPWSDKSKEWHTVDPATKSQLNDRKEDGEFWMDFREFQERFDKVEICSLTPDSLDDDTPGKWTVSCHQNRWIPGFNAGGCINYQDTFNYNPKASIRLSEEDKDPDDDQVGCNLLISLMQNHRRNLKKFGQTMLSIGFSVFKVPDSVPVERYVCRGRDMVVSSKFQSTRSVVERLKLPPGDYIIIPSTFAPDQEGEFTLRIFAEKQKSTWENDNQIRADNVWTFKANISINDKIKCYFMKAAGQAISAAMLQEILNSALSSHPELKTDGFSLKACDKMVQLLDFNKNGKLEIEEFAQLWERITQWWKIFTGYDANHSGTMDAFELRHALATAGFHLNTSQYSFMNKKYMDDNYLVDFDSFISYLVELESIFRKLKSLDKDDAGNINMLNSEVKVAFEI